MLCNSVCNFDPSNDPPEKLASLKQSLKDLAVGRSSGGGSGSSSGSGSGGDDDKFEMLIRWFKWSKTLSVWNYPEIVSASPTKVEK